MGISRRGEREAGQIDARAIARAVLRKGIERFPTAFLDEQALEIRLLCDHREDLVAERTRIINRLRWHLVDLCPNLRRAFRLAMSTGRARWSGSRGGCARSSAQRGCASPLSASIGGATASVHT